MPECAGIHMVVTSLSLLLMRSIPRSLAGPNGVSPDSVDRCRGVCEDDVLAAALLPLAKNPHLSEGVIGHRIEHFLIVT